MTNTNSDNFLINVKINLLKTENMQFNINLFTVEDEIHKYL